MIGGTPAEALAKLRSMERDPFRRAFITGAMEGLEKPAQTRREPNRTSATRPDFATGHAPIRDHIWYRAIVEGHAHTFKKKQQCEN